MATRFSYERGRYSRRYPEEDERDFRLRSKDYDDRDADDRGLVDRASDEVRSWFGDEEAERRRRLDDRGYWRTRSQFGDARARDIMSRDVVTVHPRDSIERAARLMAECDCGALPVTNEEGELIGMITDRDIACRLVAKGVDTRRASVRDAMTDEAYACNVNESIEACMRTMARHQVRRLPIVDDRDRVIGIVSQSDLVLHAGDHPGRGEQRAVAQTLREVSEPTHQPHR